MPKSKSGSRSKIEGKKPGSPGSNFRDRLCEAMGGRDVRAPYYKYVSPYPWFRSTAGMPGFAPTH
ncbi:MAG: hypothetical protein K2X77_07240 [Candidatus Obscuribacterales bacterium]|nr:hypothetical protein [Candidatus Obscuribacterales bacterium]